MVRPSANTSGQISDFMRAMESMSGLMQQQAAMIQQQSAMIQQQQQFHQEQMQQQQLHAERGSASSRKGELSEQGSQLLAGFHKLHPPVFQGKPDPAVADQWMVDVQRIFRVMKCSEDDCLSLATYMLRGEAEHWWRSEEKAAVVRGDTVDWAYFLGRFHDKFFPPSLREDREEEFILLVQGDLTVAQYDARFTELSRFAPILVSDERMKTQKFVRGLRDSIRARISVLNLQTYAEAVDRASTAEKDIARERARSSSQFDQKKFGGFKGKKGHHRSFPYKKSKSSGEDKKDGKKQVQCDFCGMKGHEVRDCYRKKGVCYGCGKPGHLVKDCPSGNKKSSASGKPTTQTRVYAIAEKDTKASKSVVEGTLFVFDKLARILFDPGANLSFVSAYFVHHLPVQPRVLDHAISVCTPMGDSLVTDICYPDCLIRVGDYLLYVDLILLDLHDYDLI